jgi:hypothetical protein
MSRLVDLDDPYLMTRELRPIKIRRQQGKTCWLSSGLGAVEYRMSRELSADYMLLVMMRDRFLNYVRGIDSEAPEFFELPGLTGASAHYARWLFKSYGVVPEGDFRAQVNWKELAKDLKPVAKRMADVYESLGSERRKREYLGKATAFVDDYLRRRVGERPKRVRGTPYSPVEFYERSDPWAKKYIHLLEKNPFYVGREKQLLLKTKAVTRDVLEEQIVSDIRRGFAPLVTLAWSGRVRLKDGFIHLKDNPRDLKGPHGRHALLVVGYRRRRGSLIGLKLQNPWGKRHGVGGFDYVDNDHFWFLLEELESKIGYDP